MYFKISNTHELYVIISKEGNLNIASGSYNSTRDKTTYTKFDIVTEDE